MTKVEKLEKEVKDVKEMLMDICNHFGIGNVPPVNVLQLKKQAREIVKGVSHNGSSPAR